MQKLLTSAVVLAMALGSATFAQAPQPTGILKAEPVSGSPLLKAASMAWWKDRLVIADRGGNRLLVFQPPDRFETLRKIENPGGVAVDPEGRLIVTTRNPDRLLRLLPDRDEELAKGNEGTPHYLASHPKGYVYWTGFPDGGTRSLSPKGAATVLEPRIGHTFGIALAPKKDALFVTSKLPDLNRRSVWRFPLAEDGSVSGAGTVYFSTHELEPKLKELPAPQDGSKSLAGWIGRVQGLAIDAAGNFYIAGAEAHTSGSAVAVISPSGKEVRTMILNVPRNISSLCLGGAEGNVLYITGAGEYKLHAVALR